MKLPAAHAVQAPVLRELQGILAKAKNIAYSFFLACPPSFWTDRGNNGISLIFLNKSYVDVNHCKHGKK